MSHRSMPHACAVALAAGLAAAVTGLGPAHAQTAAPSQWPKPGTADEVSAQILFDQPVDLSMPLTPTAPSKFDPSKLTSVQPPPTGWTAKAGVDYAPTTPAAALPSGLLLPTAAPNSTSGPAWANVTAPSLDTPLSWDKASIDSRLDPMQDQSTLGVSFSRSVPVGSALSVTVQNSYSMMQTLPGAVTTTTPTVSLTTTPTPTPSRVLDTNQALQFNVLPSDTTFSVGASRSSTDAKWLPSISAEQKLFGGPVNITGSVSETTTGEINKTLKGGFKQSW